MCWTRRLGAPPAARHQSFAGVRAYTQNAAHFACTLWLLLKHPTNDPCLPLPVPAVGLLLPPCSPIATFARCLASPAITRRSPTAFHCLAFPKHKGGLLVATPCCGGSSSFYLSKTAIHYSPHGVSMAPVNVFDKCLLRNCSYMSFREPNMLRTPASAIPLSVAFLKCISSYLSNCTKMAKMAHSEAKRAGKILFKRNN